MKNLSLPLLLAASVTLFSCKKESKNEGQANQLSGTWNYVSATMSGTTSTELSSDGMSVKAVIVTNYVTKENKGTISFENNKMIAHDLSYVTDGTMNSKQYMDGGLMSDTDAPFNVTVPSTNSSTDFVQIGTDSLYCAGGSFITMDGGEQAQSKPAGIKYRFEGDKLILNAIGKNTTVTTEDGVIQTDKYDVNMTITLQK